MIYRNTCEVCGDSYETDCWEPDNCPFCELYELREENKKLKEKLESAQWHPCFENNLHS